MSINIASFPTQNYFGVLYKQPMQVAGSRGNCVPIYIDWRLYGVGTPAPNMGVYFNLVGGSNIPQLLDQIRSVYIDNSTSPIPMYLTFLDTNFTVAAQANSTGWYPVFTNSTEFIVFGIGFNSVNIPQTRIFVTNVFAPPYSDIAQQIVVSQSLASPAIGGGSGLSDIDVQLGGANYVGTGINISGGGGTGATAHGVLDRYGQFTSVIIDNPGEGYLGLPVVTATAVNPAPAAFNQNGIYQNQQLTTFQNQLWLWNGDGGYGDGSIQVGALGWNNGTVYPQNHQVSYGASSNGPFIYLVLTPVAPGENPPNSNPKYILLGTQFPSANSSGSSGAGWTNSGLIAGSVASFLPTLTSAQNALIQGQFAADALGDQATSFSSTTGGGGGFFARNLFGSPFATGFIYLTHFNASLVTASALSQWQFRSHDGAQTPFTMQASAPTPDLVNLQKMNMKLDATLEWTLFALSGNAFTAQHSFAWTYSQY